MDDPCDDADEGGRDEDEGWIEAFSNLMRRHKPKNGKIDDGVDDEANQVLCCDGSGSREGVAHVVETRDNSTDDNYNSQAPKICLYARLITTWLVMIYYRN